MSSVGEGRGTRGFGGVRGKVLGVSVARIRTKGGLQREAGGGRGSQARATPRLCLLAEEDDDKGGKGGGLGRAEGAGPGR